MDVSSVHICLTRPFGFSASCVLSVRAISVCNEVVAVFVCGCVRAHYDAAMCRRKQSKNTSGPGQLSVKERFHCWKIGLVTELVFLINKVVFLQVALPDQEKKGLRQENLQQLEYAA